MKTSVSLWQYYRGEPALDGNGNITGFSVDKNSASFKFKQKITGNGGTKDEIIIPLKYLSKFWRALKMPLISCKISLQLKWSRECVIVAGTANNQSQSF